MFQKKNERTKVCSWVKLTDRLSSHSKHVYHREALQSADILKTSIENPASRIDVMTSSALQSRMTESRHVLHQIVHVILFLSKQGLAFQGDNEDVNSLKNPGNFLALLKTFAEHDNVLHAHLYQPKARNATYLSPRSQNDIISVIGNDLIRAKLITEIKEARYFSILADEVASHNVEHLPLCLRFVDANCDIREDF